MVRPYYVALFVFPLFRHAVTCLARNIHSTVGERVSYT
jgi:hypothetical protein